jgi:hypothetical protein
MNKNVIIAVVAAVVIIGAVVWFMQGGRSSVLGGPAGPGGALPPGAPISGKVVSVSGNTLTIAAENPFKPGETKSVTVQADASTTVERQIARDPAVVAKEQAAFQAEMQSFKAGGTPLTPPLPFTLKTITLADIKAGERVSVQPQIPGLPGTKASGAAARITVVADLAPAPAPAAAVPAASPAPTPTTNPTPAQ